MWRALARKGRADIVGRSLTTVLLGAVIAVGAATLVMSSTVSRSASTSFEDFLEQAHGGHVWVFSSSEVLRDIAQTSSGIAEAGEPIPALDGGKLVGSTADHWLSFFGVEPSMLTVAPALLTEGRWPAPGTNEAVVDRGFARSEHLAVGDRIRVTARAGVTELAIVGLHVPTSRASFPAWNTARVFVTPETVAALGGSAPAYYAAGYRLIDPQRTAAFVQTVSIRYRPNGPPGIRAWQEIRDSVVEENEATFILLGSFAFFSLIAAGFIIANSVTGQIQGQLRDIGLLKAIGMTPRQVTLLFIIELTVIGLAGSVLGVIAGWAITPLFLGNLEEMLGVPASSTPSMVAMVVVVVLATALGALAALIASWRAGGRAATAAIIGGRASGGRPSRTAAVATRLHLPRVVAFGLKDLFGRPVRAWLTVAAVAVAAAAVVLTVTMEQMLTNVLTNPDVAGVLPIELRVERVVAGDLGTDDATELISDEELVALIESHDEIERYITRRWLNVIIERQQFVGLGTGGQVDRFDFPLIEGRMFGERGEAIVGLGLARWLGLSVGDKRLVQLFGPDGPSRVMEIVGIYIEDENEGRSISFSLADLRRAAPDISAGEYGLGVRDGTDLDQVAARLVEDAADRVTVMNFSERIRSEVADLRSTIRPILTALSGFLLALVSVSLLSTLTLSIRERTREIGVLKTIGFTPSDILVSVVSGAIALSLIGAVIGAPLGWLFARLIVDEPFSSQGYDVNRIVRPLSIWWFAVIIVAMLLVAIVGSALPARRATRLRISDALRYE